MFPARERKIAVTAYKGRTEEECEGRKKKRRHNARRNGRGIEEPVRACINAICSQLPDNDLICHDLADLWRGAPSRCPRTHTNTRTRARARKCVPAHYKLHNLYTWSCRKIGAAKYGVAQKRAVDPLAESSLYGRPLLTQCRIIAQFSPKTSRNCISAAAIYPTGRVGIL